MSVLIGLVIGLVLGLTGAGGSIFAVPLLMLLLGLPINDAIGIALGAVAVSALIGTLSNWRAQYILWIPAISLGLGGALVAPYRQTAWRPIAPHNPACGLLCPSIYHRRYYVAPDSHRPRASQHSSLRSCSRK